MKKSLRKILANKLNTLLVTLPKKDTFFLSNNFMGWGEDMPDRELVKEYLEFVRDNMDIVGDGLHDFNKLYKHFKNKRAKNAQI